ncbi:MAG: tRNA pseudouridine(38-40) synthase TruA [Treponema sp.]|nr:tRNA pseudouridine(38-40) synthase TruA [Treponema sp.]
MDRNIALVLAYDGTDFSGWERQEGRRTVQGAVEAALETLHKKPVPVIGAGRTDAGVHAAGQAASFHTGIAGMDAARFVPALNSLLPRDIRVLSAREVPAAFHARYDAKSRTYRYHFVCGRQALPWELRYAWRLNRRPRIALLNDYARLLRGEIDSTAFTAAGDRSLSRRRWFFGASFFVQGDVLVFEITANAFLWKMVRTIVGTLLQFEEKDAAPEALSALLQKGDRALAGPAAPAQGLFLWKVDYFRTGLLDSIPPPKSK